MFLIFHTYAYSLLVCNISHLICPYLDSAKLRAPEKAVEAVVTALLTSAQRTKAAVALLSGATGDETV